MSRGIQLVLAVAIVFVLAACNRSVFFEEYKSIEQSQWHKDSVQVFTITVNDTLKNYNMFLNVRNDIDYTYSNLWLFVSIEQPDGKSIDDKFEVALADPTGKWLGKGFSGLKTREAIYRRNVFFPISGEYKIRIQQGMREDILGGITDVGIRLEKVK